MNEPLVKIKDSRDLARGHGNSVSNTNMLAFEQAKARKLAMMDTTKRIEQLENDVSDIHDKLNRITKYLEILVNK